MSSFANLFGKSTKLDSAVDKLFKNSADGPVSKDELVNKKRTVINIPEVKSTTKGKKVNQEEEDESKEDNDDESSELEESQENDNSGDDDNNEEDEDEDEDEEVTVKKSNKKDDNEDLESKYFDKLLNENKQENESEDEKIEDDKIEDDKSKKTKAAKTIDLKEGELEKADRTVFVGNVPSNIISSKAIERSFKKLFKHYGKIESIRYRSISFDENLPRKVAFAKKNLHKSRDSVNAYIVYKEKSSSLAAKELNSTVFEDHHLRVDHVAHPAPKDNKKTIFVGNLDFEEKEESLWKYFNNKLDNDVESVRIIRDSKTNLGKGFALVQFKDTLSVNKALLLNDKPLEIEANNNNNNNKNKKGRKLRISRAKSTAKPSLMSPNHFENQKKKFAANKSQQKLTDSQRTKLGRAQSVLGKADRSTVGKSKKTILEGQRASKGENIKGIKGLKATKGKGKVKKPRIRERSTKFKEERKSMNKV